MKRAQQVLLQDLLVLQALRVQQAVLVILEQLVQLAQRDQLVKLDQQVQMDSLKLLVQPHQHLLSLAKFGITLQMVAHIFITTMAQAINGLSLEMQT